MSNILDYVHWRGDLTLAQSPFNEVDSLILSMIGYLDFRGIIPECSEDGRMTLARAANIFEAERRGEVIKMHIPKSTPTLLRAVGDSLRFGAMELSNYVDYLDVEEIHQFSALTVHTGDGAVHLTYRGTDNTLAGWKEDFLITCMPQVPAQKSALQYAQMIADKMPEANLRMGGHSKGGNLAVYAAVFLPEEIQSRILDVYNNDGPGFYESLHSLPQRKRLGARIHSFVPASSVVGIFMQHEEDLTVIQSNQVGMLQHEGFSWEVLGTQFVYLDEMSQEGKQLDQTIEAWIASHTIPERKQFVHTIFDILESSGADTLDELCEDGSKTAIAMIKAMANMDKPTREALRSTIGLMIRINFDVTRDDLKLEYEPRRRMRDRMPI